MANPYAAQAKSGSASKMKAITGKKSGGAVYSGEASAKPKFATGGKVNEFKVGGTVSTPRADKFARGGKAKGKGKHHKGTHINIVNVAPHAKPDMAAGMPPDAGMPPPGAAPMAPPPGMGPGMPPPPGGQGMPPMKRGGAAYAKGGKVPMKAGAGTGEGRLEKIRAYGKKS